MIKKLSILVGIVIFVIISNIIFLKLYIKENINLTKTYIATHDINPRKKIIDEDLKEIYIPFKFLNNNTYNTKEEILNKYTDINGKIPKGSLFYKNMLFEEKDLPDNPSLKLKNNQVCFSMQVDSTSLSGNSIIENQRVDLYGTINTGKSQIIQDLLVSNARVVSIKDSKGYSLDNPNSNKIPATINIAINSSDLKYVYYISSIGKINIFTNSNSYNTNTEAILNNESKLITFYNENINK